MVVTTTNEVLKLTLALTYSLHLLCDTVSLVYKLIEKIQHLLLSHLQEILLFH